MTNHQREVIGTLITIGDEILLGDIPNGNAHYIARTLREKGFRLRSIVTIGDTEDDIVDMLNRSLQNSDFLVITGGLGPTEDDRTIAAVTRAFDLSLTADRDYRERLQTHLAQKNLPWSDELNKLTSLPEGSVKIGIGMAGFFLDNQDIPCYFLPGVPAEMQQLLAEEVIPDMEVRFPQRPVYIKHVLRVQGLPESSIGNLLKDLSFRDIGIDIGYLPQGNENWVTLLATAESREEADARLHQVQTQIIDRLGAEHVSGLNDEALEKVVGAQLLDRKWKMATAESCTGGLLSRKITTVPGASDYFERGLVTYSNEAKMELLGVPAGLIQEHGAVSEPVARAMVEGARMKAKVDVALAVTGIAGPSGGSPEKPVGTVFIACSTVRQTKVERHLFVGTRQAVQEQSAQAALVLLWRMLAKC